MKREDYISDEMVIKRANAAVKIELEKTGHWVSPQFYMTGKTRLFIEKMRTGQRQK